MKKSNPFSFALILSLVLMLSFAILHWLEIPVGKFMDWLIGIISFWWLLIIVILPWNLFFKAREVLEDAAESAKKEISLSDEKISYVKTTAQRALWAAIALHLISAAVLYAVAEFGISSVGYFGSGAALLLTVLRPLIRAYEYISKKITQIGHTVRYPRQDVVQLRVRIETLEQHTEELRFNNDPENENSRAMQIAIAQQKLEDSIKTGTSAVQMQANG